MGMNTGLPTVPEINDDAEGPSAGFPYTASDDTAKLQQDIEIYNDDPLGNFKFNTGGGGGGGGGGGEGDNIMAMSGPPATGLGDAGGGGAGGAGGAGGGGESGDDTTLDLPTGDSSSTTTATDQTTDAVSPEDAAAAPATPPVEPELPVPLPEAAGNKNKKSNSAVEFFERLEVQVALPVAAVVIAGGVFAAYMSGFFGGASAAARGAGAAGAGVAAAAAGGAGGAAGGGGAGRGDIARGSSTGISTGNTGNIVRRTSTSTKIDMSAGADLNAIHVALDEVNARAKLEELSNKAKLSADGAVPVRGIAGADGASSSKLA
jgi:hypothetical protein